jgi:MoaA/NifB/PqqE/SkfB family radical SAM enzyme
LGKLLQAGLDHLLLVLQPKNEQSWQAVGNALVEDLYVAVHFTITTDDREQIAAIIQRLANMGVKHVSLSAADTAYTDALHFARQKIAVADMDLVWNLPVPYSALHPVALETEDAKIEGAGRAWLYIEPDGDVRPAQGDPRILGNLLRDDFSQIFGK